MSTTATATGSVLDITGLTRVANDLKLLFLTSYTYTYTFSSGDWIEDTTAINTCYQIVDINDSIQESDEFIIDWEGDSTLVSSNSISLRNQYTAYSMVCCGEIYNAGTTASPDMKLKLTCFSTASSNTNSVVTPAYPFTIKLKILRNPQKLMKESSAVYTKTDINTLLSGKLDLPTNSSTGGTGYFLSKTSSGSQWVEAPYLNVITYQKNLLQNWDFLDSVQNNTILPFKLDRWRSTDNGVQIGNTGITIPTNTSITQYIYKDVSKYLDQVFTISAIVAGSSTINAGTTSTLSSTNTSVTANINNVGTATITYNSNYITFSLTNTLNSSATVTLEKIKLEFGSNSTFIGDQELFDHEAELLKCERFYQSYNLKMLNCRKYISSSKLYAQLNFNFPLNLYSSPTITLTSFSFDGSNCEYDNTRASELTLSSSTLTIPIKINGTVNVPDGVYPVSSGTATFCCEV